MDKVKLVILYGVCTMYTEGVSNLNLPTMPLDDKEEHNSLGGAKPMSDWFALMPSVLDFDVDKSNTIDTTEHYAFTKKIRTLFLNTSPFFTEADEDGNGYVQTGEFDKQVARVRINGDWVKVFDTDRDGKMSIEEELLAVAHIKKIYTYYDSVCTHTAMAWSKSVDIETIREYDINGDWALDGAEISTYLNDNKAAFIFYYDWNNDDKVDGSESKVAANVVNQTFTEINQYLLKLKSRKYADYL